MARKVILATHGYLGKAAKEACELVMGKQEDVSILSIVTGLGADDIYQFFCDEIKDSLKRDGELPLILVDILGGSAYGQAIRTLKDHDVTVVTGLNLPMLIEVLMMRGELDYKELSSLALEVGKSGVKSMTQKTLLD